MSFTRNGARRAGVVLGVFALMGAVVSCSSDDDGSAESGGSTTTTEVELEAADGPVRGFDGTTIKIAGMGILGHFPGAPDFGAAARIHRFNEEEEIPGVKLELVDMVDDQPGYEDSPDVSLAEATRLVTDEEIFALVPDLSNTPAVDYLAENHVPYFGLGFNNTVCSPEVTTELWGFSAGGCTANPSDSPAFVADRMGGAYEYFSAELGKKKPTMVLLSSDNDTSRAIAKSTAMAAVGAGFEVLDVQNDMTPQKSFSESPAIDRSSFVKAATDLDPDIIDCAATGDECLTIFDDVMATGFGGVYIHSIISSYTAGSTPGAYGVVTNGPEDAPAARQIMADAEAYDPEQAKNPAVASAMELGWVPVDLFIHALKIVAEKGTEFITPENVRKAASTMTWEMKGYRGPITYPKATVGQISACTMVVKSDGTTFAPVRDYECSDRTFDPKDTPLPG